jgi:hypothetical protein
MTTPNDALAIAPAQRADIVNLDPDETRRKLEAIAKFQLIVRKELKEGHDYGTIPGTPKPTLLKPGAEKLAKLLNCYDDYEIVERIEDWDKPLFRYLVRCTLADMATGTKISSGLGECNSYESKYRCRWVKEQDIPPHLVKDGLKNRGGRQTIFEPGFAIDKKETGGKYGKPIEHWAMFDAAIKDGTARKVTKKARTSGKDMDGYEVEVDLTLFQVPNPDIFDQVNTILKMAKKRALVDAALSAGRLSDLFTQDLEDMAPEGTIVEAPKANGNAPAASSAPKSADPAGQGNGSGYPEDKVQPGPSTEDQLKAISVHIEALRKLGKDDGTIFSEIYKKIEGKFASQIVELNEMTFEMADFIQVWIGGWVENIKATRAAKKNGKAA